jgi:hypothetical protein
MKTTPHALLALLFLFGQSLFAQPSHRTPAELTRFKVALPGAELGNPIFTKVLNSPVVSTPGDARSVNWVDIDNDLDLDLFISNGPQAGANNLLFKNDGAGIFTAVTNDPIVQDGKPSDGATWADFDNDGDLDCFVANWYGVSNLLYKNKGDGSFEQITTGNLVNDGGFSETASWGDYDPDGWLDLYVTNSGGNLRNFLYRNLQDGTFQKISVGNPVTDAQVSRSANWTDFNSDGKPDLFVTNEQNQHENLYRNNGDGTFSKLSGGVLVTAGGKTMSSSWADYDNDGDLDVFLANDQGNNALFRNESNEMFIQITDGPVVTSGGNSFGSQWADVDNDGDLDLFVTNAFGGGPWQNFLYLNNGDGSFTQDFTEAPVLDEGWSYGSAFGDWDRDGDLDLAVANCWNGSQTNSLYENQSATNGNHWLQINLRGTFSNRSAIGAKVWVTALINGVEVTQLREISAQSGYCGQNQLTAHFGLADADSVILRVQWPSGLEEILGNLTVNRFLQIIEGQGIVSTSQPPSSGPASRTLELQPNPSTGLVWLHWDQQVAETILIQVINAQGRVVFFQKLNATTGKNQWLLNESLPTGNYTLRLLGNGWQATQQWLRTR